MHVRMTLITCRRDAAFRAAARAIFSLAHARTYCVGRRRSNNIISHQHLRWPRYHLQLRRQSNATRSIDRRTRRLIFHESRKTTVCVTLVSGPFTARTPQPQKAEQYHEHADKYFRHRRERIEVKSTIILQRDEYYRHEDEPKRVPDAPPDPVPERLAPTIDAERC